MVNIQNMHHVYYKTPSPEYFKVEYSHYLQINQNKISDEAL